MISRWVASGMLWAEAAFRKIRHAEDLGELATALTSCAPAASLRSEASGSGGQRRRSEQLQTGPTMIRICRSTATSFNDPWDIPRIIAFCVKVILSQK
jgi:hypothetical protein